MSDETTTENGAPPEGATETVKPKRSTPHKILPSERLSPEKWQAALRAYAVVFESNGGKPVKNDEAGAIIGMAGSTIVMTNAFFCDVKLLTRQKEDQSFIPSPETLAYHKAYEWDPATAGEKLRPAFDRMWFSEVLVPRLKFRPYEQKEALTALAEACGAVKDYEPRLVVLLDLMAFAGVIVREGSVIKAAPTKSADGGNGSAAETPAPTVAAAPAAPVIEEGHDSYTLVLDAKSKRKVVVQAPHVITAKELERLRAWLGVQLIIEEETPTS